MATVNQACNLMKKWRAMPCTESNGKADRYIIAPWNKKMHRHVSSKTTKWCAITVASCLLQIKAAGYSLSAACSTQRAYFKAHKRWISAGNKPKRGDVMFITGHEGIVTCVRSNGTGMYISGNSGNAVRIATFNWRNKTCGKKKIIGYGRPIYK